MPLATFSPVICFTYPFVSECQSSFSNTLVTCGGACLWQPHFALECMTRSSPLVTAVHAQFTSGHCSMPNVASFSNLQETKRSRGIEVARSRAIHIEPQYPVVLIFANCNSRLLVVSIKEYLKSVFSLAVSIMLVATTS